MTDKIYLGKMDSQRIYLKKHSWDCNWYWGFGYLGNADWHFHFESLLPKYKIKEVFNETWLNQDNWWILLELFNQAYTLKHAYELYYLGNAHITSTKTTDLGKDETMANRLKEDLEKVLNKIWDYLEEERKCAKELYK